jgi:hypothetical protein
MSAPSRVPGSFATSTEKCLLKTATATAPIGMSASISIGPKVSGRSGRRSADRSPASYLLSRAGWSPQSARSRSTNGSKRGTEGSGSSISTRLIRAGAPPSAGRIAVSSSPSSAVGTPSASRENTRRRVRTSNSESNGFVPATARTCSPTTPGAATSEAGSDCSTDSESSVRLRRPDSPASGGSRDFNVASPA